MNCLACYKAVYPSGRELLIKAHPPGCSPPCLYSREFRREELEKETRNNYCIVKRPVKAVYYKHVCELLDRVLSERLEHYLFLGPPGTGKSLLMDILERIFPGNVIRYYPEENISKYVGESEQRFKKILERCKASQPCLLLIDEADRIVASREEGGGSEAYGEVGANLTRMLLRFLQETSGAQVSVVASTNYPLTKIDSAIFRAGRMKPIFFPPADIETVRLLAEIHGKRLGEDEVPRLLNKAVSHSNIVHYLVTGELREYSISAYAKVMYIGAFEKRVRTGESYRIIVAEPMPQALYLGVVIANSLSGKPAIVLTSPEGIRDLAYLAKASGMPLVVPYYRFHEDDVHRLLTSNAPIVFAGSSWDLSIYRVTLKTIHYLLNVRKKDLARALGCYQLEEIEACMSGITFS